MFQINEKVVCVDAQPDQWNCNALEKGKVYVVRGIDASETTNPEAPGVYLVGISIGIYWDGTEIGWRQSRFRKLSDIKAENAAKRAEVRNA